MIENYPEELLDKIKRVNDFTDRKTVIELIERISVLNTSDERNKKVFEASKKYLNY